MLVATLATMQFVDPVLSAEPILMLQSLSPCWLKAKPPSSPWWTSASWMEMRVTCSTSAIKGGALTAITDDVAIKLDQWREQGFLVLLNLVWPIICSLRGRSERGLHL